MQICVIETFHVDRVRSVPHTLAREALIDQDCDRGVPVLYCVANWVRVRDRVRAQKGRVEGHTIFHLR